VAGEEKVFLRAHTKKCFMLTQRAARNSVNASVVLSVMLFLTFLQIFWIWNLLLGE